MDRGAIGWIAVAILVLVFLDLLFVELRRAVREGLRIVKRVSAYADLPLFSLLYGAGEDAERLARALDAVPPLLARAEAALEVIRHPFAPRPAPGPMPVRYSPNGSSSSD